MSYTSSNFTVGDRVKLQLYPEWGEGTLKYQTNGYGWFIELDKPNNNCHDADGTEKILSCWYSTFFILISKAKILTKEERINAKCKLLWNKSQYVLKNPKLAY